MNIPDYIEPFVAYRTWQWDTNGLVSLNGTRWTAGQPLQADSHICEHRHMKVTRSRIVKFVQHQPKSLSGASWLQKMVDEATEDYHAHDAPVEGCGCGVYAAKNFQHLVNIKYVGPDTDYGVHGEVYLWGKIIDHELGYRAQFAYPKNLIFTFSTMPHQVKEVMTRLETLTRYNVDMFIQPEWGQRELLWSKETGFNNRAFETKAFDELVHRGARWYMFKERERIMVPGETLTILGMGIGIIQQVDIVKCEIHVAMFNRQIHKIAASCISFNQQNYRWESTSSGIISGARLMKARA